MTFEDYVQSARSCAKVRAWPLMAHDILDALRALATERAAARMTPPFEGPVQGFDRGPVSYSHWGMFA